MTHVATCRYFIHVVIDRFAARIAGWRGSSTLRTDLALNDLEQVVYKRGPDKGGELIHCTDRVVEAGIEALVGSVGDSKDNTRTNRSPEDLGRFN